MMRLAALAAFALLLQGDALQEMVAAERAFAARERVVGWKQAFLEYFAESAVGFNGTESGPAREQIRAIPDPPKDVQLLWEPRYGDIAASGELGWLTGPSTSINPARDGGAPRHGNYASVWKRQGDGAFKVVMDVGVTTPQPVPFSPGFTRAPARGRYTGPAAGAQAALVAADRALSAATTKNQAAAFRGLLASGARLHRPNVMPLQGDAAIQAWLATQPPFTASAHRFAETARSGDLGYTWGSWSSQPPAANSQATQGGFYVRVWTRAANGAWQVVLDVLQ